MKPFYRKIIPKLYTGLAIIIIPLLIFVSSGSTFNQDNFFTSSSTIKVNPIPAFSEVSIGGVKINNFSSDIKILQDTNTDLVINKQGYLKEKWDIYTPKNNNSLLNLDPVYLLPTTANILNNKYSMFNIIDNNLSLGEQDGKIYLIPFDVNGTKSPIELLAKKEMLDTKAIKLDNRSYYFPSSQSLLHTINDKYEVININSLLSNPKNICKITDNILLILNQKNQLYSYNFETKILNFLSSNIYSLQHIEDNNSIFVLSDLGIIKIDRGTNLNSDIFLSAKVSYKSPLEKIDKSKYKSAFNNDFKIRQTGTATILKFNGNLYLNQEGLKEWKLIRTNIKDFQAFESKIFIIGEDSKVFTLDIYEQTYEYITTFGNEINETSKLKFIPEWNRIFLYSENNIQSVYYNKKYYPSLPNSIAVVPEINKWLENHNCYQNLSEKSQFCLHENKIKVYRNVNLLPGM